MKRAHNFVDLTGRKFGKLTVLRQVAGSTPRSNWAVQCDCGFVYSVLGQNLTSENPTRMCRKCYYKTSREQPKVTQHGQNLESINREAKCVTVLRYVGNSKYEARCHGCKKVFRVSSGRWRTLKYGCRECYLKVKVRGPYANREVSVFVIVDKRTGVRVERTVFKDYVAAFKFVVESELRNVDIVRGSV